MTSPIQWNSVSLDRTSHFSSRKIVIFAHLEQHLHPMLGLSLIAKFLFTKIGPRRVITCFRGSPKVDTGSYAFKVWEKVENNACPSPLIIRFSLKMRETSGRDQPPDGSIGLSPLRRRRTICPSISKRAFARDSPDFAFFRHISRVFPRVTLTQTTLKITVSGRCACVCACVWLCIVYVVCCVVLYL